MTADLTFFLDRIQAEMPQRIHSRDTDSGGNPQWHKAFELWLCDGERGHFAEYSRDDQEWCVGSDHRICGICDGSGLRTRSRWLYRYPAKRALHRLGLQPVPKGRPKLDTVLWALASNDGNHELAIAALRQDWAYMWQSRKAYGWLNHALWEFRRIYTEDAPIRVIQKSESQSIAEAA